MEPVWPWGVIPITEKEFKELTEKADKLDELIKILKDHHPDMDDIHEYLIEIQSKYIEKEKTS